MEPIEKFMLSNNVIKKINRINYNLFVFELLTYPLLAYLLIFAFFGVWELTFLIMSFLIIPIFILWKYIDQTSHQLMGFELYQDKLIVNAFPFLWIKGKEFYINHPKKIHTLTERKIFNNVIIVLGQVVLSVEKKNKYNVNEGTIKYYIPTLGMETKEINNAINQLK